MTNIITSEGRDLIKISTDGIEVLNVGLDVYIKNKIKEWNENGIVNVKEEGDTETFYIVKKEHDCFVKVATNNIVAITGYEVKEEEEEKSIKAMRIRQYEDDSDDDIVWIIVGGRHIPIKAKDKEAYQEAQRVQKLEKAIKDRDKLKEDMQIYLMEREVLNDDKGIAHQQGDKKKEKEADKAIEKNEKAIRDTKREIEALDDKIMEYQPPIKEKEAKQTIGRTSVTKQEWDEATGNQEVADIVKEKLEKEDPELSDAMDSYLTNRYSEIRLAQNPELYEAYKNEGVIYELTAEEKIKFKKYGDRLEEMIEEVPKYHGTIYRGQRVSEKTIRSMNNMKKGDEYTVHAITSFTSDEDVGNKYGNAVMIVEKSKKGVYMGKLSPFPSEREVLYPKGKKLVFKKRIETTILRGGVEKDITQYHFTEKGE